MVTCPQAMHSPALHSQLHLLYGKMNRMGEGLDLLSLPRGAGCLPMGAYKDSDITTVTSQASPPERAKAGATLVLPQPKDQSPEEEMASLFLPDSSWVARLLYCVALCLLGAGES